VTTSLIRFDRQCENAEHFGQHLRLVAVYYAVAYHYIYLPVRQWKSSIEEMSQVRVVLGGSVRQRASGRGLWVHSPVCSCRSNELAHYGPKSQRLCRDGDGILRRGHAPVCAGSFRVEHHGLGGLADLLAAQRATDADRAVRLDPAQRLDAANAADGLPRPRCSRPPGRLRGCTPTSRQPSAGTPTRLSGIMRGLGSHSCTHAIRFEVIHLDAYPPSSKCVTSIDQIVSNSMQQG
jgi:hypothetical protein